MRYIPQSEGASLCMLHCRPLPRSGPPGNYPGSRAASRREPSFENRCAILTDGRALLADFDDVGRDGERRCPTCLDPGAGLGVVGCQIIECRTILETLGDSRIGFLRVVTSSSVW
jgi:hypothetical protein